MGKSKENNIEFETDVLYFAHTVDEIPQDTLFMTHSHNTYEIYLFLKGSGKYVVEGTVYPLSPNTLLMMRPGEFHKLFLDGDSEYERVVMEFDGGFVSKLDLSEKLLQPFTARAIGSGNAFAPAAVRGSQLPQLIKAMELCLQGPEELVEMSMYIHFFSVLLELYGLSGASLGEHFTAGQDFAPLVRELIAYLNENIAQNITLSDLEQRFFFNKYYLNRVFSAATGTSIHQYIIRKRLLLSQQMIRRGVPSTEACQACGFGDYSNFYKSYRSFFHKSPREDAVGLVQASSVDGDAESR